MGITSNIRVRFAPSPTGHLHIGSFRTALFNWLFARHNDGTFLVRIEDTDLERSKQEYVESITAALNWVDLLPDEPMMVQSKRLAEHEQVLQRLLAEGKAYKCFCTPQEISERLGGSEFILYDAHCRNADQSTAKSYVIRFKLPAISEVTFDDLIRGTVTIPATQLDDFIIARSDGRPTYNFVVVVDDEAMKITQVIRGEDHISNTPKQILLNRACDFPVPQYAHIPLILGPSGERLSKRDGAVSAIEYKRLGYLPDALVNYLVRLGWSHGDQEIFTREQLVEFFALDSVGKKGAIFDIEKLNWLNGVYIRESMAKELLAYIVKELDSEFIQKLPNWDSNQIEIVIDLYKERVQTLVQLMRDVQLLHDGPTNYHEGDVSKWIGENGKEYVQELIELLQENVSNPLDSIQPMIKDLAKKLDVKFVKLAQPMRIALIGCSTGPGVFDMVSAVGIQQALTRLSVLRDTL